MKFKVGDTVKITLGKDRGKTGKIEKVLLKSNAVTVTGLNLYKKHLKARGEGKAGSMVDLARPLNLAKISLICPKCHSVTRIGFEGAAKKKLRICKKCGKPID
ncbi:MAG: 50S ribosomal protein L24 [Candidatus Beckwithbacteria bacterium]|nr:50S ribosomal protein L24 [Candidatus Beckwithbacteria bacterium]